MSSFIYFFLGLIILYRSITETGLILGMVLGGLFLGFGTFRLSHIWRYFFRGGERS